MWKKQMAAMGIAFSLALGTVSVSYADTAAATGVTMENCGAYLFGWRPVDCGDGHYFAILVGGNTIQESDTILIRGYDYAYTFDSFIARPWGQVPDLVNTDGIWGIPENWAQLPEGSQPTTRMILVTNNKKLPTKERYIDIVHLPGNIAASELPPEIRKYLINVDGTDAGAYNGTETSGWVKNENGQWQYRKSDNSFVTNSWLSVDDESYYMDSNGIMLADTITPDGIYVNVKGEKTNYMPGWVQDEKGWRYMTKNGTFAAAAWIQDSDGKYYYFNMGSYMETNTATPDGYYVNADGVWDGQPASVSNMKENPGPAFAENNEL